MIGDEALNDEIRRLVNEGWALTSQADATAGMSRDELVIFLELQTDGTVRISGTGKDLAIDGTPLINQLKRNSKTNRSFYHQRDLKEMSRTMCRNLEQNIPHSFQTTSPIHISLNH